MKIKSLHIEDYKVFKDFDIDFLGLDGEALPIVVLAGVNGSGKTTILEYINNFIAYLESKRVPLSSDFIEFDARIQQERGLVPSNQIPFTNHTIDIDNFKEYPLNDWKDYREIYKENIVYFSTSQDINDIKTLLPKYIEHLIFNIGINPFDSYKEVTKYINEILKNLETQIEFDSRDGEGNLFFRNKDGRDKFSIEALSTGEKTLLSKVLYLFFQDYKEKVILIDEPELSLHPSWQNRVLKIYENFAEMNNCQIIIATHSPHIIGSAKNEYLRILKKNNEGKVEVVKDLKAEGRDINSILFDVMGEVAYRPREFDDKIDRLHIAIDDKKFDEANQRLEELKLSYGENDAVVMEAQMLIDMFSQED